MSNLVSSEKQNNYTLNTKTSCPSLDIFLILTQKGREGLCDNLSRLELKELRKLLTCHGFEKSKTIQTWQKERLIVSIVEKAVVRANQGSVFMAKDKTKDIDNPKLKSK